MRKWLLPAALILNTLLLAFLVLQVAPSPHRTPVVHMVTSASANRWGAQLFSAPAGAITQTQADLGRDYGAFSVYSHLNDASIYPTPDARFAIGEQALVYLNINSVHDVNGVKVPYCWPDVAAGTYDSLLQSWAAALVATNWQARTVITFEHEPNVTSSSQPKCKSDTPSAYRAAFDHVVTVFRADGVTSRFAFVPTISAYRTGVVNDYAPPAGDYQVVGSDVYQRALPGTKNYRGGAETLAPLFAWAGTRPVLIGEIGETETDPLAPTWITDATAAMQSHGVLAVDWNLRTDTAHYYSPALRPDSYAAWLTAAKAF